MQHRSSRHSVRLILVSVALALSAIIGGSSPASADANYAALSPVRTNDGYWTVTAAGIVTPAGTAPFLGDLRGLRLNAPIVGMATTPGDRGYWLVASDGGIFSFGNAHFFGSTGGLRLNRAIVGMAAASDGQGYWLVASDGGIFSFGSAKFFGSTGSIALNKPIVGMTPTQNGTGYWLVASDGGIFSFGSAKFFGSTGGINLNRPVVGMASTADNNGYWLVASDGGVFTFGNAPFRGAALNGQAPVYGLTADGQGGYTVLRTDGTLARMRGTEPAAATTPTISIPSVPVNTTPPTTPVTSSPTTSPSPTVAPTSGNPFASRSVWVDPSNPAKAQAQAWQNSRPADAAYMTRMGNTGAAAWVGDWTGDVTGFVSNMVNAGKNSNTIPVMIAYNIPGRDCGQWSAGGAAQASDYRTWIDRFAAGLGSGPSAVVLEPDALPQLDCLDSTSRATRLDLLRYAVNTLEARPNTSVYLDAGNPGWHSAQEMADRLNAAGVVNARGFALNVSNYKTTSDNTSYGVDISNRISNKPFVIDTSRNGNGPNGGEWCNPLGRALGAVPTANTGNGRVDALLWLKRPGESDGYCNGGPGAGVWWPDYALNLAKSAWN